MHPYRSLAKRTPFYYGWIVLTAAGSSQFVRNAVGGLTLAVFVYPISLEMGWSRTLLAAGASLGGLTASAVSPAVGLAVDRLGARAVLSSAVLILGLSTFSLGWANTPLIFMLALGTGRVMFSSPFQIAPSVLVSRWFIRKRGRTTGLLNVCHSFGMVLFPVIASYFIQSFSWQTAWMILGLIVWVFALGPVSLLICQAPEELGLLPDGEAMEDSKGIHAQDPPSNEPIWTASQASRTSALWILSASTGALFLIQAGTNVHMAAYMMDQGLSAIAATGTVSVCAIFAVAGSLFWGWISEKIPVRYVFSLDAMLMAVSSALFITTDTFIEGMAYSAIFGFSVVGILVLPSIAFADYFGRDSLGSIRGITEPFSSFGQAIGAMFSGLAFDITGSYRNAFVTYAVLAVISATVILAAKVPKHVSSPDRNPHPPQAQSDN